MNDINLKRKNAADGKWGFVDDAGNWVIPAVYDRVYSFEEGVAAVRFDGKRGFINPDGSWAIPPIYDESDTDFSEGRVWFGERQEVDAAAPSQPPIYKYGYLDKNGNVVIPPIFDEANFFCRGVAVVKFNGKWGVIDRVGKWVVDPIYDSIYPSFMNGVASAELNGAVGIMEPDGGWLVPLTSRGFMLCPPKDANGAWTLRDRDGDIVVKDFIRAIIFGNHL